MAVRQNVITEFVESVFGEMQALQLTNEETDAVIKTMTQKFQTKFQDVTVDWLNSLMVTGGKPK